MVAYNKFDVFTQDLCEGSHDLDAAAHVVKVALSNTLPVSTNTVLANITQIGSGSGYMTNGEDTLNNISRSTGTTTIQVTDVTWNATGSMGPFQYIVAHNDTQTTPVKPLISWWDHGSAVTLSNGESFTVDFAADDLFTLV